jgi:hypothetical protein
MSELIRWAASIVTSSPVPMPGQYFAVSRQVLRLPTVSGQNGKVRHWVGLAGWIEQPSSRRQRH